MDIYDKLLDMTGGGGAELSREVRETLGTEFQLGMSDYVIQHGALGEGFEKVSPSLRYYQANREVYYISNNVRKYRAQAMAAQADLLDAEAELAKAESDAQTLRAKAKVILAKEALFDLLVQAEEAVRQLTSYNKVRLELQDQVRAQYPGGIEQAEHDNWILITKYKALKKRMGYDENLTHSPLALDSKTVLALESGQMDLAVGQMIANPGRYEKMAELLGHTPPQLEKHEA